MNKPQKTHILAQARAFAWWQDAAPSARKWWKSLEELNSERRVLLLKLGYELKKRGVGLDTFFEVWLHSNIQDLGALVRHLDCLIQDGKGLKVPKQAAFKGSEKQEIDLPDTLVADVPELPHRPKRPARKVKIVVRKRAKGAGVSKSGISKRAGNPRVAPEKDRQGQWLH